MIDLSLYDALFKEYMVYLYTCAKNDFSSKMRELEKEKGDLIDKVVVKITDLGYEVYYHDPKQPGITIEVSAGIRYPVNCISKDIDKKLAQYDQAIIDQKQEKVDIKYLRIRTFDSHSDYYIIEVYTKMVNHLPCEEFLKRTLSEENFRKLNAI